MTKEKFRVSGKIVRLLGREAITDSTTALYEVIKNSHDADALHAKVKFDFTSGNKKIIITEEKGDGMTLDEIKNNFLVIGTDSRERSGSHPKLTRRLKRTMMGQKGVGRFALEKLGTKLKIVSKPIRTNDKFTFSIDWNKFEVKKVTVDMIPIDVHSSKREDKNDSGLEIEISDLRDEWTTDKIRSLIKYLKGFVLPKALQSENAFNIEIDPTDLGIEKRTIETELAEKAFFYLNVHLEKDELTYSAEKMGHSYLRKKSITVFKSHFTNKIRKISELNCGPIDLHVYYFPEFHRGDPLKEHYWYQAHDYYGEEFHKKIRTTIPDKSGVKIFRGGLREFKYGDPDMDWTDRKTISRNLAGTMQIERIVGFCLLRNNPEIIPTTSRAQALDNIAFRDLCDVVISIMKKLDTQISDDRAILYDEWKKRRDETKKLLDEVVEEQEKAPEQYKAPIKHQLALTKAQKILESDIIEDETQTTLNEIEMAHAGSGHFISKHYHTFKVSGAVEIINSQIEKLDSHTKGIDIKTQKQLESIVDKLRRRWKSVKTLFDALDNMERGLGVEKYYKREKVDIPIRQHINDMFEDLKELAQFDELKLRNRVDPDLTIWTYGPVFYTVFYNLLSNSIKALLKKRDDNKEHVILIKTKTEDEFFKIYFADNSLVPIPQENWELVFQPYITTTGGMTVFRGRGIGLSFCKDLMKFVRGEITIESPILDGGTTFVVKFQRGVINPEN